MPPCTKLPAARAVAPALLLTLAAVVAACSSSPPSRFFSLAPLPAEAAPATRGGTSVGVGPVTLPAFLDRPQLVTRVSRYEQRVDEFARWTEPLGDAVARSLTASLAVLLDSDAVVQLPAFDDPRVDLRVPVTVTDFTAEPGGEVVLAAHWSVVRPGGQRSPQRSVRLDLPCPSGDPEAIVELMSGLVNDLAREIARDLR